MIHLIWSGCSGGGAGHRPCPAIYLCRRGEARRGEAVVWLTIGVGMGSFVAFSRVVETSRDTNWCSNGWMDVCGWHALGSPLAMVLLHNNHT